MTALDDVAGWLYFGASVFSLYASVAYLLRALQTLEHQRSNVGTNLRRILARGDARRGLFYSVILLGNTASAAAHLAGVVHVPTGTVIYAAIGTALFGVESAWEMIDIRRIEEEWQRRDRRVSDRRTGAD